MQRSMLAAIAALGLALGACAQPQSSSSVTAPAASPTPAPAATDGPQASAASTAPAATSATPTLAPAPSAAPAPTTAGGTTGAPSAGSSAGAKGPGADLAAVDPKFRPCHGDADCVAVPRAGCCHNGWLEAVASTQKDAYANANACTMSKRPICPMYVVKDERIAKCEAASHLCVLVKP